jgi:hypothetical protein
MTTTRFRILIALGLFAAGAVVYVWSSDAPARAHLVTVPLQVDSWLSASVTSTVRNGVARRRSGSAAQARPSVSMCQMWSRSTWAPVADARRWKGASFRSARESTDQQ